MVKYTKTKILFIAFTISFSGLAMGAPNAYSPWATINMITIGSTGIVYAYHDAAEINPAGCTSGNSYALWPTHPAKEMIFTTLTTAWAAEKKVRFYISGTECNSYYPKIILITVAR